MTIGERIKARRLELGLSVDEVADKLGKNRATIYRYESSEIEKIPTVVLEPLSQILKVSPAYLMGWDEHVWYNYKGQLLTGPMMEKKLKEEIKQNDMLRSQRGECDIDVIQTAPAADVQPVDFVQNEVLNYLFNKEREAESMPYSDVRQERIGTLREIIRYVEGIGDING